MRRSTWPSTHLAIKGAARSTKRLEGLRICFSVADQGTAEADIARICRRRCDCSVCDHVRHGSTYLGRCGGQNVSEGLLITYLSGRLLDVQRAPHTSPSARKLAIVGPQYLTSRSNAGFPLASLLSPASCACMALVKLFHGLR
jgi:hypothetical protein